MEFTIRVCEKSHCFHSVGAVLGNSVSPAQSEPTWQLSSRRDTKPKGTKSHWFQSEPAGSHTVGAVGGLSEGRQFESCVRQNSHIPLGPFSKALNPLNCSGMPDKWLTPAQTPGFALSRACFKGA